MENVKTDKLRQHNQEQLLEEICTYARKHMTQKITLKEVAKHCGVSVSTVTQLFRKLQKDTFHNYVTKQRMEQAENLIREGVALEEAGRQVGYTDHSSFYRAFCQIHGKSPREFKRSIVKE